MNFSPFQCLLTSIVSVIHWPLILGRLLCAMSHCFSWCFQYFTSLFSVFQQFHLYLVVELSLSCLGLFRIHKYVKIYLWSNLGNFQPLFLLNISSVPFSLLWGSIMIWPCLMLSLKSWSSSFFLILFSFCSHTE